jgi:branched-subunit amino acid aminotransferase/4-amino-4-deoxychorismate lyase
MGAQTGFVYLNSRLLPATAAVVPVFDRGFSYGDSIFETLKVSGGRPVFFDDHFQRLKQGMDEAGFRAPLDAQGLKNQALSLAEQNGVSEGRLRILLSRGTPPAPAGIDPPEGLMPTLLVTVEQFSGHPEAIYHEGVSCRTVPLNRGGYARIKSAGLLATVLARRQAHAAGAFEALFTAGHGRILEGSVSNVFFLREGKLSTAPEERPILAGVTRQKVIDIAAERGLEVEYAALATDDLEPGRASAFLTGSVLGICPVSVIDGVGLALDTALTDSLRERLRELEQESIS